MKVCKFCVVDTQNSQNLCPMWNFATVSCSNLFTLGKNYIADQIFIVKDKHIQEELTYLRTVIGGGGGGGGAEGGGGGGGGIDACFSSSTFFSSLLTEILININ